jgi:hypothetical protein
MATLSEEENLCLTQPLEKVREKSLDAHKISAKVKIVKPRIAAEPIPEI